MLTSSDPYTVSPLSAYTNNTMEDDFRPIPELQRSDADVNLLGLFSHVMYTGNVTDQWFDATIRSYIPGLGIQGWVSSRTVSVLGCTEKYQFCNGNRCNSPTGLFSISGESMEALRLNARQIATFHLLWKVASAARLRYILYFLGNKILVANEKVYGAFLVSSPLPDNQWQIEMENLNNLSMAVLQQHVVEHASPQNIEVRPGVTSRQYIIPENTPEGKRLCANQKTRHAAYSSFNLLGICVIIFGGSLIILVNLSLPHLVGWIQKMTGIGLAARLDWIESETLQLQRMAFEGRGIGPWIGKQDRVPTTAKFGRRFPRTAINLRDSYPLRLSETSDPLVVTQPAQGPTTGFQGHVHDSESPTFWRQRGF
ncbi:hypothetical protein H2201_000632 [Coniosporium apollinis]|uniref:Uncharacterized protein n=1 Tax=Coniosporium apollinis TaxID=61459 RepID=A0ABQ9P6M7_9PEZI|nr:hypothetical protein H2201_000632 [Coniosporium apollinis]